MFNSCHLHSYQRRAFLLLALVVADPAALSARAQTPGAGITARPVEPSAASLHDAGSLFDLADLGTTTRPVETSSASFLDAGSLFDLGAQGITARPVELSAAPAATPIVADAPPNLVLPATRAVAPSRPVLPETLWDVLSRIDRDANAAAAAAAAAPVRLPLGAVPGFTLPASKDAKIAAANLLSKRKGGGAFGALGNWFDELERATHSTVKMSGSANLSLRSDSVSGGADATSSFQSDQYLGRGGNGVYTDTNLHVDATLFDAWHYSADMNNSLYSRPDSNKLKVDYKTKSTDAQFGDITAGFKGNSLIDFSRYLSGVETTNHWTPQLSTTLLFAQTKGDPQTRVIQGNNSAGPYFVFSGQIVEGSVSVRVDNQDKVSGKDYTLDPISGELRFLNGEIVLATSTIAVTYETLDNGETRGGVYGFRADIAPKSSEHFGMTYLMQQSIGSTAPVQYPQQFAGFSSGTPYPLQYPVDTTKPISVTVDGVPMVQGKDFTIDATLLNQFYIWRNLTSTNVVIIKYYPLNTNPTPGNRSVLGLDGTVPLGRIGSMTLESAFSGLDITGNNVEGQAWQAKFKLTPMRSLTTNITIKDINPSFSSIQSPGFNQNEKSAQISADYSPNKRLHFTGSWEKAKRPSYTSSTTGTNSQFTVTTNGNDTYNQYTLGMIYNYAKNGSISLNRNSFGTNYIIGGSSTSLSDSLTTNYTLGKVVLDAGLTRNISASNSVYSITGTTTTTTGTTPTNYNYASNTFSKHAGLTWTPVRWFHLNGTFSDNNISSTGNSLTGTSGNTTARDEQLTTSFDVTRSLKFEYGLILSDTGTPTTATTTTTSTTTTTTGSASTGTTSTGTSSTTSTGVAGTTVVSRMFYQFFHSGSQPLFVVWRDATTGTTTTTTTATTTAASTIGTTIGTAYGGGINSALGTTGNYGGLLGNSYSATETGTSLGGRSLTNRVRMAYSPNARIHTNIDLEQSSAIGDYLYNSNRNSTTLALDYTLSKRTRVSATYSLQKVAYTGGLGGTNANTLNFDFEGNPFGGKLSMRLGWQSSITNSNVNQSSLAGTTTTSTTTTTGTTLTNTSTNLSSYLFHVEYPIRNRISIFYDLSNTLTTGYEGSSENDNKFGLNYALTQFLQFSLGWQLLNHINLDPSQAQYNYHTSSLLAEFGLRF